VMQISDTEAQLHFLPNLKKVLEFYQCVHNRTPSHELRTTPHLPFHVPWSLRTVDPFGGEAIGCQDGIQLS
jgi:hypothetical protein